MERCAICGISSDKAELFDAISDSGIIKVCERCAFHEHLSILKRPQKKTFVPPKPPLSKDLTVKMGANSRTMYERLSRLSGVSISEKKPEDVEISRQNKMLRETANRNFQASMMKERGDSSELVADFHWKIMRARRGQHISTNQLAEAIGEPESAIRMAEQGIVPKNVIPFMKKIENYFKIKLIKSDVLQEPPKLDFSSSASMSSAAKNLSLRDLRGMKPEEVPEPSDSQEEDFEEPEESEQKETTDEEEDELLFR